MHVGDAPSGTIRTHGLVATIDGRIVGLLNLHLQTNARRRDCAWFGMAVHDDVQGQGVGTALMQAMIELAGQLVDAYYMARLRPSSAST